MSMSCRYYLTIDYSYLDQIDYWIHQDPIKPVQDPYKSSHDEQLIIFLNPNHCNFLHHVFII